MVIIPVNNRYLPATPAERPGQFVSHNCAACSCSQNYQFLHLIFIPPPFYDLSISISISPAIAPTVYHFPFRHQCIAELRLGFTLRFQPRLLFLWLVSYFSGLFSFDSLLSLFLYSL